MLSSPEVRVDTAPTMRIVVDLPAPLGPRSPNDSPGSTANEMPSTAAKSRYFFMRAVAVMTGAGTNPSLTPAYRFASCQLVLTACRVSTTVDAMTDSLHILVGESGGDDPLAALRAVRQLRLEVERQEATLVRVARNRGFGWQMIATALGVSRQAVHKKYGRR